MTDRDELLLGAEPVVARDSDGDGVSDVQERLDGTNPNDAADAVRHDAPSVNPSHDPDDPRQGLRSPTLENTAIVDVKANMPAGHSLDQTLGTGLDGKPITGARDHYGNAQADKLLGGHKDAHSPRDMQRDPTQHGASPGGHNASGPPTEELAPTTNPAHNRDLVSLDRPAVGGTEPYKPGHHNEAPKGGSSGAKAGTFPNVEDTTGPLDVIKNLFETKPATEKMTDAEKALRENKPAEPTPPLPTYVPKPDPPATDPKTMTDPDAGGGTVGGVPTDEDLARALVKHGAATDVVRGYGGPQIEGDSPTKRAIDFVKDPNPDDENTSTATSGMAPRAPGQDISHTINPNDGILGGRDPSRGGGGGNTGAGNDGRESFSSAATADSNDSNDSKDSGDSGDSGDSKDSGAVTSVDSNTGGGIHSVAEDETTPSNPDPSTDNGTAPAPISHDRGEPELLRGAASVSGATPTLNVSLDPNDPRGDLLHIGLERETVVDVKSGAPAGFSIDQTLGTGLDGKPISTARNHYGNADADKLLAGHGADANSPANIQRDPLLAGASSGPTAGHDATIDTLGRAPGPSAGGDKSFGGRHSGPPPGEAQSGSADPDHNMGLVSQGARVIPQAKDRSADQRGVDNNAKPAQTTDLLDDIGAAAGKAGTAIVDAAKAVAAFPGKVVDAVTDAVDSLTIKTKADDGTMTNPDGDDGTVSGPVSAATVERAVAVHGGNVDFVQGFGGGPQIEGDAPPKRAIDFVKDPNPDDDTSSTSTTGTTTTPRAPGADISHTINPNDGILGGRDPSRGPGGGAGAGDGRNSFSSAATAADNDSTDAATSISVVGSTPSGGGIHSVAAAGDVGLDPVADAMADASGVPDDSVEPLPIMRDIPDDLAIPDGVELDDGF